MQSVSVIIPIYNAFDASLECIESVIKNSPDNTNIIAIDDVSTEGSFIKYFTDYYTANNKQIPANLKLLQNGQNLGFVGTCNRGMMLESNHHDVILLNSDTVVTKNWILKLQKAAYSNLDIATVTPLTNNGTICSVPEFLVDNDLPDHITLEEYASTIERLGNETYPTLPTCVGFCTYIKREVLDRVGYFDPVFNKGYGEENDFSLRCQKLGYRDILDDTTFIHHKGSLSFKDMKEQFSKENTKIISERYPQYFNNVSRFCADNPLLLIQERIQNALVIAYEKKHPTRILHVIHNGPFKELNHDLGGTELHVRQLINGLPEFTHWSLAIHIRNDANIYMLSAHLPNFSKIVRIEVKAEWLKNIINCDFFEHIHIHHTMHFDKRELAELCEKHPSVIYSIHDYFSLCPRVFMRTKLNNVCTGVECTEQCEYKTEEINTFRSDSKKILTSAKKIIVFSNSSKQILNNIFGQKLPVDIIAHGLSLVKEEKDKLTSSFETDINKPAKIAFLSPLVNHKGKELILESSKILHLPNNKPLEWHLWSDISDSTIPKDAKLILHGRYNQSSLYNDLREAGINLIVIPSLCNETFSYTLAEAWNAGVPVIVTPYGALKERVENTGAGWVLKDETVNSLIQCLNSIFSEDDTDYKKKQSIVRNLEIKKLETEIEKYELIYKDQSKSSTSICILEYIQKEYCTIAPEVISTVSAEIPREEINISQKIKGFIIESSRW